MNTQPNLSTRFKLRIFLLLILTSLLTVSGVAQVDSRQKERPKSFSINDNSQAQVQRKALPAIDADRLRTEEQARAQDRRRQPGPERFAVAADVNFTLENSGTWQNVPDGRIWRLRIQTPGARSQNLAITRFEMPDGTKLWIYDPDRKHVEGPYTARNRSRLGSLWTPIIEGEEMLIEVFVPTGVEQPKIRISKVNQGFRSLGKTGVLGNTEGACEIDIICPEGAPWQNQARAVNVFTINGTAACTGNLLNNTALDFKPYVLSANHCGVTTATDASIVVYWNFQSPVCGDHGPGNLTQNQSGATFRAGNGTGVSTSDFVLFELDAVPDPSFNVFYAGWDRSGTAPPSTVTIHHPAADVKTISFSNTPAIATNAHNDLTDTPSATGLYWRANWDSGVTEHGSSGSCLFDTSTGRCIGQLWNGPSSCSAVAADRYDFYGRFSVSWTGGGTNATRLSNWLDPGNTGVTGLDGDPHLTTADGKRYDFQGAGEYVALRQSDGLEVQVRQDPVATTFNPGPNPQTGLATCVSLNTAVAAKVGSHRVTYQPNLSGVPDPSGLQLRVDGALATVPGAGLNLPGGGRVRNTSSPGGLRIDFPNGRVLLLTPTWWSSQSKWYLNVDLTPSQGLSGSSNGGAFKPRGIAGTSGPGSWLPVLPDGTSMGPMPSALHQRYVDLYQKFGQAWRVTDSNSLFDYAPGTSTANFTMLNWPVENPPCDVPKQVPVQPVSERVAIAACAQVKDENARRNCVFDVRVTGNTGFATTYLATEQVLAEATGGTSGSSTPTPPSSSLSKFAVFFDAGVGFPNGTFSNVFDPGFSFNAGLEYMVTPQFSAEGIFGYHRFPGSFGGHTDLFQLSGNGKVYLVGPSSSLRPFVNGGVGAYITDSGTAHFGGNVGAGVLYQITPKFGIQGSYNFHAVNTSGSAFKFSTVQGGVRFVF